MDWLSIPITLAAASVFGVVYVWIKFVKRGPVYKSSVLLQDKTVLITGGSYGIGKEAAIQMAKLKARVIIASRNVDKATKALFDIRNLSGNNMVHFMRLDLSDFSDVRRFVRELLASEPRLDILVNNAGVVKRGITVDGYDTILATNHLGPFLLTNLLLPLMKETAKSNDVRVVNVSADAYKIGKINLKGLNLNLNENSSVTNVIQQYCNSKLMNIYFTTELHRRLSLEKPEGSHISTFALHPGVISSGFASDLTESNLFTRIGRQILFFFGTRPLFYGCQTILYCCLEKELEKLSGCYFSDLKHRKLQTHATDANLGLKLWEWSEQMTGL